jgi:UDP-3-O-[3-hydroxymyristoyl] glucosamine N-acyltransferase
MAGGKAGFSGHLEVADDVTISADTNVTKSIDKAGVYTSMIPLQSHADWVRNFSHLRRLDAMAERLRELEKKLGAKES